MTKSSIALNPSELAAQKGAIRQQVGARRRSQSDKDVLSKRIQDRLMALQDFKRAKTVLFYIDVRSEVRTRLALVSALAGGKTTVIPYCVDDQLRLFHMEHAGELAVGTYGVLEPRQPLRDEPVKCVDPETIDLAVVPGVAFDRKGHRLGQGQGHYDRLLQSLSKDAILVGLAYECQMVPEIPIEDHDVIMTKVITERAVYNCSAD